MTSPSSPPLGETTALTLTVEDVNAINQLLEAHAEYVAPIGHLPSGAEYPAERKRIADLMWKLVALGQQIERGQR